MFIKLNVERFVGTEGYSESAVVWFDVHTIHAVFTDDEGITQFACAYGPSSTELYRTKDADADDLVEAIIQLRMHPAEGLPSRNVGSKSDDDTPGSTGSFRWSAKDAK